MAQRITRSKTAAAAAVKKAAVKSFATTEAVPSGPPTKRLKTNKAGDNSFANVTARTPTNLPRSVAPPRNSLELPMPADTPPGHPRVYYGQDAPYPRWRTLLDVRPLGKSVEKDLIRTHPGKTIIPGVAPNSHPKTFDFTIGLGALYWVFDPDSPSLWGDLTGQELHTHAHECLAEALACPLTRKKLRDTMHNEQYAAHIANVFDPIPPLPSLISQGLPPMSSSPLTRTADPAISPTTQSKGPDIAMFRRPMLTNLPDEGPFTEEVMQIASILKRNYKGAIGPPDHQDPSLDPIDPRIVPKTTKVTKKPPASKQTNKAKKSAAKGAKEQALKGAGSQDIELEKKVVVMPPPAFQEPTPKPVEAGTPVGDGSKIVHVGGQASSCNNPVNFVHKALGKERATGQKAAKGPDHGNAPGPSRTAANRKTPAGADVEEISKILRMPTEGNEDEALKYFRRCNEILENPEARQKHYPKVEAFRRIRSWAGAIIPEEAVAEVKVNYSKVPTPNRPFQNIKGPLELPTKAPTKLPTRVAKIVGRKKSVV